MRCPHCGADTDIEEGRPVLIYLRMTEKHIEGEDSVFEFSVNHFYKTPPREDDWVVQPAETIKGASRTLSIRARREVWFRVIFEGLDSRSELLPIPPESERKWQEAIREEGADSES